MKRSPLHQQLYEASHDLHARLDSHPLMTGLFSTDLDQPHYIRVMSALHRGLAPVEKQLLDWETRQGHGTLPAYQPRLPLLEADLASLGVSQAPPVTTTWHLNSAAAHAGVRYVLEGACRGSVPILKSLGVHDWLTDRLDFWQRQTQLAELWPRVTRGLEALNFDRAARLVATQAACRVFESYLQALDQEYGK
jgi:heme oxygenase